MKRARISEVSSRNSQWWRHPAGFLGIRVLFLAILFTVFISSDVSAYEYSLHGFLEGNYSMNITEDNPDGKNFKWSEERVQIKFEAYQESFRLFVKEDAFYDNIERTGGTELREGYGDYSGRTWEVRAGRQIITWGLGDLLFINDVFPKDYNAFFSGRPLEYMKKGIDGVKIGVYPGYVSIELVAIPVFEPNTLPDARRFWMFDPLSAITNREEKRPSTTLENTETALRIYRDVVGFDTSVYFYRGYFRQPSAMPVDPGPPPTLKLFYPRLNVYGASLQGRALDGVLSLEAAYYDSREDQSGTNAMIPNSQSKYLVGYQRQLWEDFTLGIQYYVQYLHAYAQYTQSRPVNIPTEDRLRQLASIRVSQLLMHQTLKLSFFALYGMSDKDYLLNPEVKYNLTDAVWLALGANIFGGEKWWSQFGQQAKNDNVYLQARYEM